MNEDWTLQGPRLPLVPEVKSQGQLEVELDCPTLMGPPQGIVQMHVDLRPIEGSISGVEVPGFPKFFQRLLKNLLSLVPETRLSQEARRPGGQCQAEGEAKDSIDRAEEIQAASDLCFQLGAGKEGE